MATDAEVISRLSRILDEMSRELRDVRERVIRIEERDLSARIRQLEEENRGLREWRVEVETKGQMMTAGLAALVSIMVSVVSAGLGYLLKG